MSQQLDFPRAAVLGAGVMGAQIAAQLANCGLPVRLYELPGDDGDERGGARRALERLARSQPPALTHPEVAGRITPSGYASDLERLGDCPLVIEAVAERPDVKRELYGRVAPYLDAGAVLATNTSGLSIEALAGGLPEPARRRFCGVHFFNPPRYMHLVELIPAPHTDPGLLDRLEAFLVTGLGKGVVRAKDTPNFVANRIGVLWVTGTMHHAARLGLAPDVVDALTGPAIGRPKTATFGTADLVGLDVLRHVVEDAAPRLADDPWGEHLALPRWLTGLVEQGALGRKAGAGVYRKEGDRRLVFDPERGDYRPAAGAIADEVEALLAERDPGRRLAALAASDHPQAELVWAIHRDLFHYAAYHLAAIAHSARDVDLAMRWGYGWSKGPFEAWQNAGWGAVCERLEGEIAAGRTLAAVGLPGWVAAVDAAHTEQGSYDAARGERRPRSPLAVYRRQYVPDTVSGEPAGRPGTVVEEGEALRLWAIEDDVGILSFKTRNHVIGAEVLGGIPEAVAAAGRRFAALIVWQPAEPFSLGADLKQVAAALEAGRLAEIEALVERFQAATAALRYAPIPTVAAVRGMALGGGCEVMMHCDRTVAAQESYPGLVETGVGLIPGGGGCKELARRAAAASIDGDLTPWIRRDFESLALAKVARSAAEARARGLLQTADVIVPNPHELLHVAHHEARALAEAAYRPPLPEPIAVAGREALANLRAEIANYHAGGFISEHDVEVARRAATALCGGDVEGGSRVDEAWLLRQEREGFMALAATAKTYERIVHMLKTGKPLRN